MQSIQHAKTLINNRLTFRYCGLSFSISEKVKKVFVFVHIVVPGCSFGGDKSPGGGLAGWQWVCPAKNKWEYVDCRDALRPKGLSLNLDCDTHVPNGCVLLLCQKWGNIVNEQAAVITHNPSILNLNTQLVFEPAGEQPDGPFSEKMSIHSLTRFKKESTRSAQINAIRPPAAVRRMVPTNSSCCVMLRFRSGCCLKTMSAWTLLWWTKRLMMQWCCYNRHPDKSPAAGKRGREEQICRISSVHRCEEKIQGKRCTRVKENSEEFKIVMRQRAGGLGTA